METYKIRMHTLRYALRYGRFVGTGYSLYRDRRGWFSIIYSDYRQCFIAFITPKSVRISEHIKDRQEAVILQRFAEHHGLRFSVGTPRENSIGFVGSSTPGWPVKDRAERPPRNNSDRTVPEMAVLEDLVTDRTIPGTSLDHVELRNGGVYNNIVYDYRDGLGLDLQRPYGQFALQAPPVLTETLTTSASGELNRDLPF